MTVQDIEETDLAWFAGLFEGEGTFWFAYGKPKGLSIQMTDLDVLQQVQRVFGGTIVNGTRVEAKPHWKPVWKWSLGLKQSLIVVPLLMPYLFDRRFDRACEFMDLGIAIVADEVRRGVNVSNMRSLVFEMYASGSYTHQQIADTVGYNRTYVTHILRGKYS